MNDLWRGLLGWVESWDASQGFWTAVQSAGTVIAALAAMGAVVIARSQLAQLIESNKLLSNSNKAMTASNVAAMRPYITVDFDFRPVLRRTGGMHTVTLALKVENIGRNPAKNLKLALNPPFEIHESSKSQQDFSESVKALNRLMNGTTVVRNLSPVRPLVYFIDDAAAIMRRTNESNDDWTVTATYEDAGGQEFSESFHLELEHWKLALISADPLARIAKNLEGMSYEFKNQKPPRVVAEFPAQRKRRIGRIVSRRFGKHNSA